MVVATALVPVGPERTTHARRYVSHGPWPHLMRCTVLKRPPWVCLQVGPNRYVIVGESADAWEKYVVYQGIVEKQFGEITAIKPGGWATVRDGLASGSDEVVLFVSGDMASTEASLRSMLDVVRVVDKSKVFVFVCQARDQAVQCALARLASIPAAKVRFAYDSVDTAVPARRQFLEVFKGKARIRPLPQVVRQRLHWV